jgi:hypothetical protein
MVKNGRGRSPSEDLVSLPTAARMLGVTARTIHLMCRQGLLDPVYKKPRGPKHFPVNEVAALAEVRHKKMDLPAVAALSMRAFVIAKANERRLDELFRLLGLRRKVLGTTTTEVVEVYEKAAAALEVERMPLIHELEDWAATFFAIDEAYLRLVISCTASEEPWKVFLDLATKYANNRKFEYFDAVPELRAAYDQLEAARRNLRMVAYMFCRETKGVSLANTVFGTRQVSDRLLDVMFSS